MTMRTMTIRATPACIRTEDYTPKILVELVEEVLVVDGELVIGAAVSDLTGYFVACGVVVGVGMTGGGLDG